MSRLRRFLLQHAGQLTGWVVAAWIVSILLAIATRATPRLWWFGALLVLFFAAASVAIWARWQRERAIRESPLPQFLKRKLREAHPHLDGRAGDLVERGFRQFFLACARSDGKFVAMPSKVVDTYWHEFILHTRAYGEWCALTLGHFLHHTPAEALGARAKDNDGLRRAWFWACKEESIDPRRPSRLPLLFALDAKLAIEGGFTYAADCRDIRAKSEAGEGTGGAYCGTSFSDGSYAGDGGTFGGSDTSSSGHGGEGGHGDGGHGGGGHGGDGGASCGGDGGGGGCGGGGD